MNTIENNTVEAARPVQTLESLYAFKGESFSKAGDVTVSESIRLGVALIARGEESKARGIFVLADKAKALPAKELETFKTSLKSEMENAAVEKAIALCARKDGQSDKAYTALLDAAKAAAKEEAGKRYDNLGQTLRAAQWMLANPKKIADGISVFTVQQANAYLELPAAKEGKEVDADKAELHKTVTALLGKPGTSQAALKKAVAEKKAALAESKATVDKRSDEQKLKDAAEKSQRDLVFKLVSALDSWDKLVAGGAKPEEIRALLVNNGEPAKGNIVSVVRGLATLAGLQVK